MLAPTPAASLAPIGVYTTAVDGPGGVGEVGVVSLLPLHPLSHIARPAATTPCARSR
jgi:hypothetical protein